MQTMQLLASTTGFASVHTEEMTKGDLLWKTHHKVHLLVLFHSCIRLSIALTITYLQSSIGVLPILFGKKILTVFPG